MKNLKSLLKLAYKYRFRYLLGIVFLLIVDGVQLIPPKLVGYLTDSMQKGSATSGLILTYIIYIILVYLCIVIGRFMWRIYIFGTSRHIEYDMRNTLFKHLQSLSTNFYNHNKTGDLMSHATNDLNSVRMALAGGVVMSIDAVVMTLSTIAIMLSINVKLTLLVLIPLPFLTVIARIFGKTMHKKFTRIQEAISKLTDVVQENFSGIRIVKSFVQEEKEYEKFTKENQNNFNANMSLMKTWGTFNPLIELIASISFITLLGVGGTYALYGYISLGDFISFNMYLGNLIWPMMAIGWVMNQLQRGLASYERIENILNQKPEVFDSNPEDVNSINGDINIRNLTFRYPDTEEPALKNINLSVKKGQTLGIVGKTGSGKSTLVNLLVRLYNVETGEITINEHDINKIPLSVLRENIGFVPQDSFLFSTNIAENINLGLETLDMEKVYQSARDADIYDNIMDFSNKFETVVGERGVTLSGGQKQRVAIGRALVKDPEILVFDDCLSAVDAKTEAKILLSLKKIMKDKTSIIISHRISAIKDADVIIALDEGEIIEKGSHQSLVDKKGLYNSIYEKQLIEQKIQEEEV
ncbi:MAG: multidrug transporter ATP-binding protein [Clostridiales bacterium]|jgi:ATP-binding cassette subfamily B protein|nr:multidrug transporter ATP-binding protein [Clostridiales bacterium]